MLELFSKIVLFPIRLYLFFFGWGTVSHFSNIGYLRKRNLIEKTFRKLGTPIEITGIERYDPFEIYYFKVLEKKINEDKIKHLLAEKLDISAGKIFFRNNPESPDQFKLLISRD